MEQARPIRRALLSVSDKTGILEFAKALNERGVALLSTGGTAKLLADAGLPVTEVSDYTGFPEMMDGRVKTLHPKVHGGILGREQDDAIMAQHAISPSTWSWSTSIPSPRPSPSPVVPWPMRSRTSTSAARPWFAPPPRTTKMWPSWSRLPTMTASSAMDGNGNSLKLATRFDLAIAAFEHTAAYDGMIANYFGTMVPSYGDNKEGDEESRFPRTFNSQFIKKQDMRYGENSHQAAAFYAEEQAAPGSVASATQLQGKALSYNNIADTDAALECVKEFDQPACVIVKHANPCGVAIGSDLLSAYERAWQTDPTSAFGGIIAFNRELDGATAKAIVERQFVEVIIAPPSARLPATRSPPSRTCGCSSAVSGPRRRKALTSSASTAGCWCRSATLAW